jgi:hypothetical protein
VKRLKMFGGSSAYFVGVSEPCSPFLLAADKSNPLVTAPAQAFPYVGIPIHAAGFLRLLKGAARRSADTVSETLIVPESAVLEDKPTAGLTNSTPTFALVSVAPNPTRRIEVTVKAKLLLVRDEVGITRIHVFWRWWNLLVVKGCVKIRRVAEVSIVRVQRMRICVAL